MIHIFAKCDQWNGERFLFAVSFFFLPLLSIGQTADSIRFIFSSYQGFDVGIGPVKDTSIITAAYSTGFSGKLSINRQSFLSIDAAAIFEPKNKNPYGVLISGRYGYRLRYFSASVQTGFVFGVLKRPRFAFHLSHDFGFAEIGSGFGFGRNRNYISFILILPLFE